MESYVVVFADDKAVFFGLGILCDTRLFSYSGIIVDKL